MTRISLIISLVVLLGGCSFAHSHKNTAKQVVVKVPSSRCKIVEKRVGKYSSVLVRKNCLRNGKTEVVILLHAVKFAPRGKEMFYAKKGVEESVVLVLDILGFRPKLAAMAISRVKGIPCYVFLVTGNMLD